MESNDFSLIAPVKVLSANKDIAFNCSPPTYYRYSESKIMSCNRYRRDSERARMRERLLMDIQRSRQGSTDSVPKPLQTARSRSYASRFIDRFDDLVSYSNDISTAAPTRCESPSTKKQRLSFQAKSQSRISGRPQSVMAEKTEKPRPKKKTLSYKDSIVSEYKGQQKRSLKLLKYTVPRSLMTKRQQLQLFGKVSVSFRRVQVDL
mmetsp:Transcript_33520/g.58722  ORF Transcript_33520/g.58722 Transcript_33520/m.58722 type:complete len:206 (-) Transcript_33520:55-672(-)